MKLKIRSTSTSALPLLPKLNDLVTSLLWGDVFFTIETSESAQTRQGRPLMYISSLMRIKEPTVGIDREEAKRKFEAVEMINN